MQTKPKTEVTAVMRRAIQDEPHEQLLATQCNDRTFADQLLCPLHARQHDGACYRADSGALDLNRFHRKFEPLTY